MIKLVFWSILIAIIIIWSLNLLYKKHRDNSNVLTAINNRQTIRQLTQDEYQQFTLSLDDINKVMCRNKRLALIDDHVSIISGDYTFFSSSPTISGYFIFLIGGVKCILSECLSRYLTDENNVLQVVFTRGYALAVVLNGHHCIAANVIDDAITAHLQCWFDGQKGALAILTFEDIKYIVSQDDSLQLSALQQTIENKPAYCEVIAQRQQTVCEKVRENQQNSGFISIVCLGFTLLILSNKTSTAMLLLSCVTFIAAVVYYFLKSKGRFEQVNQIIDTVQSRDIGYGSLMTQSRLNISYPDYWQAFLPYQKLDNVDMDVTVGDVYLDQDLDDESTAISNIGNIELLRYGDILSINNEIKWYGRPKFWGRNCVILVGSIIFSWLLFLPTLKDDIAFSYHFLTGQIRTISDQHLDMEKPYPIKSGDWVMLNIYPSSNRMGNQRSSLGQSQAIASTQKNSAFIFNIDKRTEQSNLFSLCPVCWQFNSKITQYGRVLDINYDNVYGINQLTIYADLRYKTDKQHAVPIALVQTLCFVVMVILGVLQLLIVIIKINSNKRRIRRIVEGYRRLIL